MKVNFYTIIFIFMSSSVFSASLDRALELSSKGDFEKAKYEYVSWLNENLDSNLFDKVFYQRLLLGGSLIELNSLYNEFFPYLKDPEVKSKVSELYRNIFQLEGRETAPQVQNEINLQINELKRKLALGIPPLYPWMKKKEKALPGLLKHPTWLYYGIKICELEHNQTGEKAYLDLLKSQFPQSVEYGVILKKYSPFTYPYFLVDQEIVPSKKIPILFYYQIGAYSTRERAQEVLDRLSSLGYRAFYKELGDLFKVYIESESKNIHSQLEAIGFSSILLPDHP